MTVTEFLLARITEDEALARSVVPVGRPLEAGALHWSSRGEAIGDNSGYIVTYSVTGLGPREHIARHDPARVLAECAAKRAIIEGVLTLERDPNRHFDALLACQYKQWMRWFILPFAAVYAGHPDYDPEWAL